VVCICTEFIEVLIVLLMMYLALIAHRLDDSGLATVSKCQPVNVREGSGQLTSAGLVQ
jgi:hypothetical protein